MYREYAGRVSNELGTISDDMREKALRVRHIDRLLPLISRSGKADWAGQLRRERAQLMKEIGQYREKAIRIQMRDNWR